MRELIIASTSTIHGSGYLDYLKPVLRDLFSSSDPIVFIPYARPGGLDFDGYTDKARAVFKTLGLSLKGIHEYTNPHSALEQAGGIFVGGGNTFLLVQTLYENDVLEPLKKAIAKGVKYLGTSAGSNICGLTMGTTNDMPIVHCPSFDTLGIVPFNINPHYLDPDPDSTHMGETREMRIAEFHQQNEQPVIGLREGSYLHVVGDSVVLKGPHPARWFQRYKDPIELPSGSPIPK